MLDATACHLPKQIIDAKFVFGLRGFRLVASTHESLPKNTYFSSKSNYEARARVNTPI